jgi:TRAP-type mannitol/chloroaromatic compound transport system permease small subunit
VDASEKFADAIDSFVDGIGRFTAWSSFALALVMAGNVLLRYVFNTGSVWAQELEWHLMAPICLFGMSFALRHGEHVRVDVLFASFSERRKLFIEFFSSLLLIAICAIIIWLSWSYVAYSWNIGEGSANPGGIPARYIVKSLIPIGFGLMLLQALAQAIHFFHAWRKAV